METTFTYKKQGDGRDSWVCEEPNGNKYMVFEDPNAVKTTDIVSLLKTQSPEQLIEIKKLLGL